MGRTYYYMRISTAEERGKQKFTRQEKSIQDYCKNQSMMYLETIAPEKRLIDQAGRV